MRVDYTPARLAALRRAATSRYRVTAVGRSPLTRYRVRCGASAAEPAEARAVLDLWRGRLLATIDGAPTPTADAPLSLTQLGRDRLVGWIRRETRASRRREASS